MIALIVLGIWFVVGILIYGIGMGIINFLNEKNKDNFSWQYGIVDRETAIIVGSVFWPFVPFLLLCIVFCMLVIELTKIITKGTYLLLKNKDLFKWINLTKKG